MAPFKLFKCTWFAVGLQINFRICILYIFIIIIICVCFNYIHVFEKKKINYYLTYFPDAVFSSSIILLSLRSHPTPLHLHHSLSPAHCVHPRGSDDLWAHLWMHVLWEWPIIPLLGKQDKTIWIKDFPRWHRRFTPPLLFSPLFTSTPSISSHTSSTLPEQQSLLTSLIIFMSLMVMSLYMNSISLIKLNQPLCSECSWK